MLFLTTSEPISPRRGVCYGTKISRQYREMWDPKAKCDEDLAVVVVVVDERDARDRTFTTSQR